jgi:hypothetical protein
MASYIKTLKEDNGDITYPQTLGSAVLLTGGADLETELAGKASAASVAGKIDIGDVQSSDIVANAVTTNKIADDAVTPSKASFTTYSSAEQEVGTWTDGNAVYRKTFHVNSIGSGSTVSVPHSVTGLQKVIKIEGTMLSAISGQYWPIPMYWDNTTFTAVRADTTNIYLNASAGQSVANSSADITIYYTKSS